MTVLSYVMSLCKYGDREKKRGTVKNYLKRLKSNSLFLTLLRCSLQMKKPVAAFLLLFTINVSNL